MDKPEQVIRAAEYLQTMTDYYHNNNHVYYQSLDGYNRGFPPVSFGMDSSGHLNEICFGNNAYEYKGRHIPYNGICAGKD